MKTRFILALLMGLISTIVLVSCKKSKDLELAASRQPDNTEVPSAYEQGVLLENGSILCGGVTLTAPTQVDVNESFDITASVECGRVSIERGYILAGDNITKIYKDLSCSTAGLEWESLVGFECYDYDANWTGSFAEPGNYVFRTKHNAADGNCDSRGGQDKTGECSFSGVQFYCFVIEAVDACETSFTGQAIACGNEREAVYTFTSKDALSDFKIQGGLTNFTGADAVVTVTGGSNILQDQWTVGGSSNRVIKVEGDIAACETITIRITWNSTNSGGVITGSWSVSANGNEVAPAVAGLTCTP
jgi:hypothetical protein